MQTWRVALVGCGPRGLAQGRAYRAHPRTELVAVCDRLPERRETLANELGVASRFTDAEAMVRSVAPDIVAIPTGTEFHYPLCRQLLAHACHLDVEKPLCWDLAQADTLVALARQMAVKVAVHHQTRVGGAWRAQQAALRAGQIGEPQWLTASDKGYYGGFGLLNIGTHLVTNLTGLVGHCRAVSATALTNGSPLTPEDVVLAPYGMGPIAGEQIVATLEFDHGVLGTLRCQRFAKVDSAAYGFEVYGTSGRLLWRAGRAWGLAAPHDQPGASGGAWQPLEPVAPPVSDPTGAAQPDELWYVEEFVRALDEDRAHPCSIVSAAHTLEVLLGVLESAALQRRVELPQPRRAHPLLAWRAAHRLPPPPEVPRDYGPWLAAEEARWVG
ncbi:MAG: Gfo/Idh/MocA family oxidoreductase [Fimbriimonadaceae bacterium]|nr:Gfo/Idh/MocA family oxidoreductase [Fimbriimonadaceae bacterium]